MSVRCFCLAVLREVITQLINTPARLARSAHRLVLHLPRDWPWEPALDELFTHALYDPVPAAA